MRVVSLRRLDGQKLLSPRKRNIFYLVPKMIVAGIIIASLLISLIVRAESRPTPSKPVAKKAQKATLSASIQPSSSLINPEQLLPESGNMANLMANKFFEIVPLSAPDCKAKPCVALTFDDGPNDKSTPIILTALEQHLANATFFEIGKYVKGQEKLLQRMARDGDDIGNHSWSHLSFLKLNPDQMKQQVDKTQKAIMAAGVPKPYLFRPPYGDFLLKMEKDIKLTVILWNVDPKDWAQNSPDKIALAIEKQIKPGAIIVLHDKPDTAAAINKVLTNLKSKYNFVTVTELLNLKPGAGGAYVGR